MTDKSLAILNEILAKVTNIESKIGSGGGTSSVSAPAASGGAGGAAAFVAGYDKYCREYLDPFVASCDKLGGEAAKAGDIIKQAWGELRTFLVMASECKEPNQAEMGPLLEGISSKVKEASSLVKRNEWEKHTKTVSEGIGCLSWVVVKPAPQDFIESYIGGSDYWANNIRKEYKTSNPDQIAFCNTFKDLLKELRTYVKTYHTTGVSWNKKGVSIKDYKPSSGKAPAAAKPAVAKVTATTTTAPKADLFSALNKDTAVTSGLKKVTKDMQTWRTEYKGDAAAPKPAPKPKSAPAAKAPEVKGPAKLEFQAGANKWIVENQVSKVDVAIKNIKETVYIYGCAGAEIHVTGKCKSVILDSCKKTSLHFDTAMASCEVVNCQRINVYVKGSVPSVAIDKTDGIVVTLPMSSLHTEIVASKSSEMNVQFPLKEGGDLIEKPIPEQYVHRIKNGGITADVSDLYGH